MKILLVTPPVSNIFYPPLGLPSLAAFLRRNSNHQCFIADLSLEGFLYLLSEDKMTEIIQMLHVLVENYKHQECLDVFQQAQYSVIYEAYFKSKYIVQKIPAALSVFYDEQKFRDYNLRKNAIRIIDDALEIVSAVFQPFEINRNEVKWKEAPYNCNITIDCLEQTKSPFFDFFQTRLDNLVAEHEPEAIGVSINYYGQLITGVEVLKYLKNKYPGIITIVGGSLMPEVYKPLLEMPFFSSVIDHLIIYEGETALLQLLDSIEKDLEKQADNIIVNKASLVNNLANVQKRHREPVATLPVPDFKDFKLEKYLSPHPVLPYLTSRGCYWADCAFCTHFHTYGIDYRTETAEKIVGDLCEMQRTYNTNYFYFVDESLAPSKAKAISLEILKKNLNFFWGTELRFEKALSEEILKLMADSGCKVLSFGLESGVQRVLDFMKKGIKVQDEHRIIDQANAHGIKVHTMCIIGFPSETREEFFQTLELINKHKRKISLVGFSPFTLNVNSIVHKSPEDFGIIVREEADSFRPDRNYITTKGLSQEEIYDLYNQVRDSPLVHSIEDRSSIATREHLLFNITEKEIAYDTTTNEDWDHMYYFINPDTRGESIPFSLTETKKGQQCVKKYKDSIALGMATPKTDSYVYRSDSFLAYVSESGRLLELSKDMYELIFKTSDTQRDALVNAKNGHKMKEVFNKLTTIGIFKKERRRSM